MKRIIDYISVIMFFTIVIMIAVSTVLLGNGRSVPVSDEQLSPTQTVDEYLLAGFPLKDSWQGLRTGLLLAAGRNEIDGSFFIDGAVIKPVSGISDDAADAFVSSVNTFASENSGVSVCAMIVPSASGVYSADIPSVGSGFDQKRYIEDLYLSLDRSVAALDAFSTLYSSRENYIFMRTDNSLTSNGAFGVYYSTARKMGLNPRSLSEYDTEHAMTNFYGSLCDELSVRSQVRPDSIELFVPKNGTVVKSAECINSRVSDSYSSVFDRNALLTESPLDVFVYGSRYERVDIRTINTESPRLLIIKTRETNPVIPFFVTHYSRVTVIDIEKASLPLSAYAYVGDYDQVLFMVGISSFENAAQGLRDFM